jgi:nitrogen PTS system EIIA component
MTKEALSENEERLLTIEEVAGFLHMNPMTVYAWVREGKIPAFKIGKVWRFRKTDIESWLKSQKYTKQGRQ